VDAIYLPFARQILEALSHLPLALVMDGSQAGRANKVRWGVAQAIAMAWFLTIPATALVGAGLFWLFQRVFP
jgi:PiT family inorganic phosphate transporter